MYIGQTGDALLGGLALFVMSLGMGIPLLLIGLGAGRFMPKTRWLDGRNHKNIWNCDVRCCYLVLDRVLDATIIIYLWAFITFGTAVYLKFIKIYFSSN